MVDRKVFIAIGPNGWGRSSRQEQAVSRMRQSVPGYHGKGYGYHVYECSAATTVDEVSGGLSYPHGDPAPNLVLTRQPVRSHAVTQTAINRK